ncbi:MAG: fumarate hydratase [Christensenellaceae bacterium]
MRELYSSVIEEEIYRLAKNMCFEIDKKVECSLLKAYRTETGNAKYALKDILDNVSVAREKHIPVCQDTGIVLCFVEIGEQVFVHGSLKDAVNRAVSRAYTDEYLRKSVVKSPLDRINTHDNTPAIIYTDFVPGDKLKITLCPKGAGSENMGRVKMLTPSQGENGIIQFVTETVRLAGGKACPPLIVGVGIGGDMEMSGIASKKALLRDLYDSHGDEKVANLEKTLLKEINALNIGAMGLKGKTTALGVKVEVYPCHIASLPVSVSLMCHASRHKSVII